MATDTVTHYWTDTFYGPGLCACGGALNMGPDDHYEAPELVTCEACLEWYDNAGY